MATLAIGTYDKSSWTLTDRTDENTTHEFQIADITDETLPDILDDQAAYQTALLAITNGVLHRQKTTISRVISNLVPTDNTAQRESKLQVFYRSNTTEQTWDLTIGTIDFAQLTFLPGAGDYVAITSEQGATTAMTNFVTAFQAYVKANDGSGAAVTITAMKYVGRNN